MKRGLLIVVVALFAGVVRAEDAAIDDINRILQAGSVRRVLVDAEYERDAKEENLPFVSLPQIQLLAEWNNTKQASPFKVRRDKDQFELCDEQGERCTFQSFETFPNKVVFRNIGGVAGVSSIELERLDSNSFKMVVHVKDVPTLKSYTLMFRQGENLPKSEQVSISAMRLLQDLQVVRNRLGNMYKMYGGWGGGWGRGGGFGGAWGVYGYPWYGGYQGGFGSPGKPGKK